MTDSLDQSDASGCRRLGALPTFGGDQLARLEAKGQGRKEAAPSQIFVELLEGRGR